MTSSRSHHADSPSAHTISIWILFRAASLWLCLFLPAAGAQPVAAADYVWRNVKVGGGGYSPSVVFSRAERGLAYLRTDIGGVYRWDAKADTWIPLQDNLAEGNYLGIESVAPDPADPNTVYVAAGMYRNDQAAILRSKDRGETWDIFQVPFHMGGNDPGRAAGERLAVDPNDTSILYFGSRYDGLQKSTDKGKNWAKVASFPVTGTGFPVTATGEPDWSKPVSAGISFVVFDPASGKKGEASRTIFVGSADPGPHHLFRSDDAGQSWKAVAGEPRADLLPVQAGLDEKGILTITYSIATGPYGGIKDGAVFKLDTKSGKWTDITPDKSPKRPAGGYIGLALDHQHHGTLMVATAERYNGGDTIWRSTDGGAHWQDIRPLSKRDVSETPFLLWGKPEADFGWWMSGLAIDPFDASHVAYTTGATIYATNDFGKAAMTWRPWSNGVEETAVLTLTSLPAGPPLLSGFGDIGGFAHDDLNVSPASMYANPVFGNTNTIDFAGQAPNVVVRSGTSQDKGKGPTLAYSTDYGHTWAPITVPPLRGRNAQGVVEAKRYDLAGDVAIEPSADGSAFIVMTPVPLLTYDHGQTWAAVKGLPVWGRVVADRVNPRRFYAFDLENRVVLASDDGGANFTALPTAGLPADVVYQWPTNPEAAWPLMATPGVEGDLWIKTGNGRLFHSADGGKSFKEIVTYMNMEALAFGKAAPGKDYPTLYTFGWGGATRGIFRSTDVGKTWKRVNDDDHQYGRRFRCIAGDPRVYGRVYIGTDGRGIVYGEPEE